MLFWAGNMKKGRDKGENVKEKGKWGNEKEEPFLILPS
jgi:hypothetical protein